MGLLRFAGGIIGSGVGALGGAVASGFYKEYIESGDMSGGILMKRGVKMENKRNTGDNNLVSNGSYIDVQENQCMILVDNGRIVDFTCEAGQYVVDNSSAPSCFSGNNKGLYGLGEEIKRQFTTGGMRSSTQRVFFINMGEIITNPIKWGFGEIDFTHRERRINGYIQQSIRVRGNGEATIRIVDAVKFYKMIGAQFAGSENSTLKITDAGINSNLRTALVDVVGLAISNLSYEKELSYTALRGQADGLIKQAINEQLSQQWAGQRGFEIASFTINTLGASDEDKAKIQEQEELFNKAQHGAFAVDMTKAMGIKAAGENGASMGETALGMGMLGMAFSGGMNNMQGGYPGYQQQPYGANPYFPQQPQQPQMQPQQPQMQPQMQPTADSWSCSCGTQNTGKFCLNCGSPKPVADGAQQGTSVTWTCSCGATNNANSKFCPECGNKKPVVKKVKCDKCGWTPAEGQTVRFCPECGDIINDEDYV